MRLLLAVLLTTRWPWQESLVDSFGLLLKAQEMDFANEHPAHRAWSHMFTCASLSGGNPARFRRRSERFYHCGIQAISMPHPPWVMQYRKQFWKLRCPQRNTNQSRCSNIGNPMTPSGEPQEDVHARCGHHEWGQLEVFLVHSWPRQR